MEHHHVVIAAAAQALPNQYIFCSTATTCWFLFPPEIISDLLDFTQVKQPSLVVEPPP